MNKTLLFLFVTLIIFSNSWAQKVEQSAYLIPAIGNSFEIGYTYENNAVGRNYVSLSKSNKNKVSTYFKLQNSGKLDVKVLAKVLNGSAANMNIALGKIHKNVSIKSNGYETITIGTFDVDEAGYYSVDFLSTTGDVAIESIILEGSATSNGVLYCRDPKNFYWTRRGPSCHLAFISNIENASYYYNEVTVPKGFDVMGSYFMAIGFSGGYFGIQANSETERRILFSVWSPYSTNDPKSIPDDQQIKLLKKGKNVYSGEFGNEGSGGQSYLRYQWKAGATYKFLLKGLPDGDGNTDYSAWFYNPDENSWNLIASFKRPKTNTYLKGFHSFLENFNPNQGYLTRQVEFKNQWIYNGQWHKVEQAKLTVDATYTAKNRVDATGGKTGNGYFLKMGGFFNDIEKPGTEFKFDNKEQAPKIDFSKLP